MAWSVVKFISTEIVNEKEQAFRKLPMIRLIRRYIMYFKYLGKIVILKVHRVLRTLRKIELC